MRKPPSSPMNTYCIRCIWGWLLRVASQGYHHFPYQKTGRHLAQLVYVKSLQTNFPTIYLWVMLASWELSARTRCTIIFHDDCYSINSSYSIWFQLFLQHLRHFLQSCCYSNPKNSMSSDWLRDIYVCMKGCLACIWELLPWTKFLDIFKTQDMYPRVEKNNKQ